MDEMMPQDSSAGMALDIRGVDKTFTARPVLRRIDLAVPKGQAVCLCGINGAGKSTLLRIVAGLLRPDDGRVTIGGFDIRRHPEDAKRQIGMISHASMVYPELTVFENLSFAASLYGISDRGACIDGLLAGTALAPFRHDRAGILSRGLLQRLSIAKALLHKPAVLLADEPFTGLDAEVSERLVEILGRFVQEGGTILMTTHDTRLGLRCCHRVAVLDKGSLVLDAMKDRIDANRFTDNYLSYARSLS